MLLKYKNIAFAQLTHERDIKKVNLVFFLEDGCHIHYYEEHIPSIIPELLYNFLYYKKNL